MSFFKRKSKNEKEKKTTEMQDFLDVKNIEKKTDEKFVKKESRKKAKEGNVVIIEPDTDKTVKVETVQKSEDNIYAPLSTESCSPHKFVSYKPLVSKKLTIILVENTVEVVKAKEMLIKIVKNLVPTGLICIINYGSVVMQSEIFDVSTFDDAVFLCNDDAGDEACLYDALAILDSLIFEKYMKVEEINGQRVNINECDIVGIGTCKDSGSVLKKEDAIQCFCKVSKRASITTKYFCLTEENFMDAAEIGFHSIGAIFRNY